MRNSYAANCYRCGKWVEPGVDKGVSRMIISAAIAAAPKHGSTE